MLLFAADLPDPLVGIAPLFGDGGEDALDHLPHVLDFVERARHQPVILPHEVHQVAERIVLLLVVGVVADAHGLRALVSVEMFQNHFGQFPFAADAVHDLVVVA